MKNSPPLIETLDFLIFGWFIRLIYPLYKRPKYGYQKYYILFFHYFIPQKIFRLNPKVKWPVHFTSKVLSPEKITKGINCDPGDNFNNYIQANNGIHFGHHVELGPGVSIISANHEFHDFSKHIKASPIIIGNNVWIGTNSVILPEVKIGDNVIIGAGSVVTKNIPSNTIAAGNPCKKIRENKL